MDAASWLTQLRQQGVDSVLSFRYDYDNGTLPTARSYVVWQHAGQRHLRAYQGCELLPSKARDGLSLDTLFSFYTRYRLDTLSATPAFRSGSSHQMGYYILVYLPYSGKSYHIRDDQRQAEIPELERLPEEQSLPPQKDPRSSWLDLLEQILQRD
ncbi:hypothetical protein [Hymenobacter sp. YC55]|uniref:hypothetical protein n=1 Tax=Hymenobacter sp. YC55 TaxID=3034019 RepID=UPI0023F6979C|nr:hypothetical protein [Hymenobacter sp. YC55]MDF7813833.1 hypothetical protein [Hymenobacter sp. YC55]